MTRWLMRLVMPILTCTAVGFSADTAVDTAPDVGGVTRAARDQAEQRLTDLRMRVATDQAELLKRLHAAVVASTAARERLTTAESEAKAAADAVTKRMQDQERELTLVKQLADRAVIGARITDSNRNDLASKPPVVRVAAAIAALDARIQALPARLALSLSDEPIVARSGTLMTVPVLRLGEARAIALGRDAAQRGLLERAADGSSWLVVGPTLPTAVVASNGAATVIPLDAAGSAAQQSGAVHRTFTQWVIAGRAFIWPILAVFVVGVLVVLERCLALARRRVDAGRLMAVATRLADDDAAGASDLMRGAATPLDRVLRAGLNALGRPREIREAVVEQALLAETAQLTRGLPAVAVLAGVAPLLGLLGTVTGMIDMFSVIAAQGSGNAKSLSGGISEALICTQAGMLVAIPLLLAHAWLSRLADRRAQLLEEAACGVLGLSEHGEGHIPAAPSDSRSASRSADQSAATTAALTAAPVVASTSAASVVT